MTTFIQLRDCTRTILAEGVAVPQGSSWTSVYTIPQGAVYVLATFSAAPGNLTVRYDEDADRIEFRTSAVDWVYPAKDGIGHPLGAAVTVEFRSVNACNIYLRYWAPPDGV